MKDKFKIHDYKNNKTVTPQDNWKLREGTVLVVDENDKIVNKSYMGLRLISGINDSYGNNIYHFDVVKSENGNIYLVELINDVQSGKKLNTVAFVDLDRNPVVDIHQLGKIKVVGTIFDNFGFNRQLPEEFEEVLYGRS